MQNATPQNIIECVKAGIQKAVKEHYELTNGYELSFGPEYFLTVSIAREMKRLSSAMVIMEENMDESKEVFRGRRPKWYSPKNRYDIVVRKSNGYPTAAIEVKHRVYEISQKVVKDLERLTGAVKVGNKAKSTFKVGIFAFYVVVDENDYKRMSYKDAGFTKDWRINATK